MKKKILLTGITGFIGRNVAREIINKDHDIICLIRPGTPIERWQDFQNRITPEFIDLADISGLKSFLANNRFDIILHIGALRGGRKYSRSEYFQVNVNATEQLMINAWNNDSEFIFCSSVGVFGAIPDQLPADNDTTKNPDNYYHFTKIRAERLLQSYVLKGLKGIIIRPSIAYGPYDYGFPYTLVKLIDKKLLYLPDSPIKINLTHIDLLTQAFEKALETDQPSGSEFIVADSKPVEIHELADYISTQIHGEPYSRKKKLPLSWFRNGEKIATLLHNELWTARFELISRSWFYDTAYAMNELGLKKVETIPGFKIVTDWYKKL